MACSTSSSWTNLLIIMNLLQQWYCKYGSQMDEMDEENKAGLESSISASLPHIRKPPPLSPSSLQNPTAVNRLQARAEGLEASLPGPHRIYLLGKNGASEWVGG